MLFNGYILINNKLILEKIIIQKKLDKFIINISNKYTNIIKIPIYNIYTGLYYVPIQFPLEIIIYNNYIFNPYIVLTSDISKKNNDLDFFYILEEKIKEKYNFSFYTINQILNINNNILYNIINNNYNISNILNNKTFNIETFWSNTVIIKLYVIYLLINKNIFIPKEYELLYSKIINIDYDINNKIDNLNILDIELDLYLITHNIDSISIKNKLQYSNYNTFINKYKYTDSDYTTNINKYNFFSYLNNNSIEYTIFKTFINYEFTYKLFNILFNNNTNNISIIKIFNYYNSNNSINNKLFISNIFDINLTTYEYDLDILKSKLYDNNYFYYITNKYSHNNRYITDIIEILIKNYTFTLNINKHDMTNIFDYLIYYSLYNYEYIFIYSNVNINLLISIKIKKIYFTILHLLYQIINDNMTMLTYNKIFYIDKQYKNIINIFISNSNNISVKYFKELIKINTLHKFIYIYKTTLLLINLSLILNWTNLFKKINYLYIYYKNYDILYFKRKINNIVFPELFDIRIINIIYNPFEMYKYLNTEKDYIFWSRFIIDNIYLLYIIPIDISNEDIDLIAKLLYLLYNINSQCITDITYINFIIFCNKYNWLIIKNNKINIKIKEYLSLTKIILNLGILTKHILNYNNI